MKQPVTGVQLYTLRNHTKTVEDFTKTLAWLSEKGVHDIQISAIGPTITPLQQKEALDRYAMRVCVTHQSFDRLCSDLDAVIEAHKIIGCDSIGLGYAPDKERTDEDSARAFLKKLCEIAKTIKQNGLQFHYHNHAFEFAPLPGSERTLMELMMHESDPETLHFIPDVAWIHYAGLDPVEVLQQMKGRVKVVHFKDYVLKDDGSPQFVSLGKGVVDLNACYQTCCELEFPFVMYEQDNSWVNDDPFLATEESLAFFQTLHI